MTEMNNNTSIIQSFRNNAARLADKPALIVEDTVVSYGELDKKINNLSNNLHQHDFKQGDHIGVLLPNSLEFVALMLAAANLGLVLVPHNMSLSKSAIITAFKAADVTHVVLWHAIEDELKPVLQELGNITVISVGEACENTLSFTRLMNSPVCNPAEFDPAPDLPYILTMTSGSTGKPKPIVLSQQTKYNRALAAIELYAITENDIVLAATPLYHSLAERLVLIPLLIGGTSVVMSGFSASKWLKTVDRRKVSFSIAVSSQLKQIIRELRQDDAYSLQSLRCLVSSSERLDNNLKSELFNFLACDFHECYGTSEIAIATNLDRAQQNKLTSVGIPAPSVEIAILGEQGTLLATGQPGEIICKTPMLFSGYYKQPEKTAQAMYGEFFCTGDLGKIDHDGFLYFLGRRKDIIITGGINVYPKDIEDVLITSPDVLECAVIPISHEGLGEIVAAIIVTDSKDENICLRSLQKLCARELADFQQPRQYHFVAELPKNPMGKIQKRELVDRFNSTLD